MGMLLAAVAEGDRGFPKVGDAKRK